MDVLRYALSELAFRRGRSLVTATSLGLAVLTAMILTTLAASYARAIRIGAFRHVLALGAILAVLAAGSGNAQPQPASPPMQQQMGGSASQSLARPGAAAFGIANYGEFRKMMMQADFTPKVAIGKVIAAGATDGVGALSEARGEITIIDGVPVVSYGTNNDPRPATAETAMLLATAIEHDWQEVAISRDVAPEDIEGFLASEAKSHGIDPEKSFPYRLRGTLINYAMHVIAGPNPGHKPPYSVAEREGDAISGLMVGLYVGPPLVGIATHPGERTHTHWISDDGKSTAHLDRWGVRAGTVLLLPKIE